MKRKNYHREDEGGRKEQKTERGNSVQDQRNKSQELKKLAKISYFEQKNEWVYQKQYGNYNQRHRSRSKSRDTVQEKKQNVIDDKEEHPTFRNKNMSFDQLLQENMISNIKQKVKDDNLLDSASPYNIDRLQIKEERTNQQNEQQLKGQLDEQQMLNKSLQNNVLQLQNQMKMVQNQCQRYQEENRQYSDEMMRLRQELQRVKQQKQEEQYGSIQSNERMMVQMNSMKQDYELKVRQLEMEKKNIEKENKFELEQQKYEIQQLYQQNEELHDNNSKLNNELRTLNHQFYVLMIQYNNLIDVDHQRVKEKLNMIDNVSESKQYSDQRSADFKDRINQIVIDKPSRTESIKKVSFSSNRSDNMSIDNLSFKQTSRSKSMSNRSRQTNRSKANSSQQVNILKKVSQSKTYEKDKGMSDGKEMSSNKGMMDSSDRDMNILKKLSQSRTQEKIKKLSSQKAQDYSLLSKDMLTIQSDYMSQQKSSQKSSPLKPYRNIFQLPNGPYDIANLKDSSLSQDKKAVQNNQIQNRFLDTSMKSGSVKSKSMNSSMKSSLYKRTNEKYHANLMQKSQRDEIDRKNMMLQKKFFQYLYKSKTAKSKSNQSKSVRSKSNQSRSAKSAKSLKSNPSTFSFQNKSQTSAYETDIKEIVNVNSKMNRSLSPKNLPAFK